jgi:FkbM family methyltransferase
MRIVILFKIKTKFISCVSGIGQIFVKLTLPFQFQKLKKVRIFSHPRISWSQCAEDLVLEELIGRKTNGFYIDLGAHDPNIISVTKLFYDKGWSGINIEANPYKLDKLKNFRPRDINLNVAIGKEDSIEFSIMSSSAMSTGVQSVRTKLLSEGSTQLLEILKVKCVGLKEILDHYVKGPIDFINIDIEGMDLEALETADFKSLPKSKWPIYIVLESKMPVKSAREMPVVKYVEKLGYEMRCVLPHVSIFALENQ